LLPIGLGILKSEEIIGADFSYIQVKYESLYDVMISSKPFH